MSRIKKLFERKSRHVLNVYFTAGFPQMNSTPAIINALQQYGADLVELGMPYSDPLADGPVIQHSNSIALANGMTIQKLFEQLRDIRNEIRIPVILMGYMNPVLQYGFEKFCADASAVGVDGLILPDMPVFEFETGYGPILEKYGLDFIFLVTPETPADRVKKLDSLSRGFLYAVSASSTTGAMQGKMDISAFISSLKNLGLKNPVLVGFGINNKEAFESVCLQADGAIIGTAFIKALENSEDVNATTKTFLSSFLQ